MTTPITAELPVVVGGYARTGKDTVADYMVAAHGFTKVVFSDAIRQVLYALNPMVPLPSDAAGPFPAMPAGYERVARLVDAHGWEGAYRVPEVRKLLQRLGAEAGPDLLGWDLWVKPVLERICGPGRWVVCGCRRTPEQAPLDAAGAAGRFIRVHRPGVGPKYGHATEVEIDTVRWDYHIANDGSIDDLHRRVDEVLAAL